MPTGLPQTFPAYRKLPARAFNVPIVIRPASYTPTVQGGTNPATGSSYAYMANVQPIGGTAQPAASAGGVGGIPQSVTTYEIRLPYDADDTVITGLRIGDEIDVGDTVLTVSGTSNNVGGMGTVWLIRCAAAQS